MSWVVPKIWQGGDVWILGGGPSVPKLFGVPDEIIQQVHSGKLPESAYSPYLKFLHDKHVIGINVAYKIGNWIDIIFFGDTDFFSRYHNDLAEWRGLKVTCSTNINKKYEWVKILERDRSKGRGITSNPRAVSWNGNSGAAAISLAVHTGAKRIFLLGFDMHLDKNQNQHWHNVYKLDKSADKKNKSPFFRHLIGFKQIAHDAKRMGVVIYNVCPDSAIQELPKIDLQQAIELSANKPIIESVQAAPNIGVVPQNVRAKARKTYKAQPKDVAKGCMRKYEILSLLHEIYNPQLYFEIGVDKGESIRLAKCAAIGVDPHPDVGGNVNKAEIHRLESDLFFKNKLLKGRKPDLVFIDGLHHFDQVVRDFINVEKTCKKDTVVVIDDILPAHEGQTVRKWLPGSWTGDVWKIIPILQGLRPDLKITLLDSSPTGLMLVTNLDATSTVLTDKYDEIISEWMDKPVPIDIINRENMDVRTDIEQQIRNFRIAKGKKILCFVNHYYNPDQTEGFKGGATTLNPNREVLVKMVIDRFKNIEGCDVKICGIKGFTVPGVDIDIDFTGKQPHHIVYESLNLMAKYANKYDYFINVEDDIWVGDDVLNNIFEFDESSEINEIFLPNRIEITGSDWNLIDLSVSSTWTDLRKQYKGGTLCKSTNHHSGLMIMRTDKFKKAVGMLDKTFREIWFGGPMASAFAYFHTPFILYRNYHPTKYHSVIHLDQWKNNEKDNRSFINREKAKVTVPKKLRGPNSVVTALCVVYNTKDVFEKAYTSIREHHPDLPILIIDNSDKTNDCFAYVESISSTYTKVVHTEQNIGHGRGMDMGLRMIQTPYALLFDSDIEMVKSPVSKMVDMMDKDTFGVGWIYNIGLDGQDHGCRHKPNEPKIPYLHPYFQLIQVANYKKYHPYVHHGAPCYLTMVDLWEKKLSGKVLKQFEGLTGHTVYPFKPWTPIPSQYVNHKFAQTRNMNIAAGNPEIIGTWVKPNRNAIEAKIPYGLNGDLAGAYNEAMESASTDWVLLLDQDVFLCNPNWYTMCLEAINKVGPKVGLITCVTNFVETYKHSPNEESQKADIVVTTTNIEDHIRVAKKLYNKYHADLRRVTSYKVAGFFMLVNKEIWQSLQFQDIGTGLRGIDWNYCKRLLDNGYEIYEMPGLYVYHRRDLRLLDFSKV